jgi:hypothetical protein
MSRKRKSAKKMKIEFSKVIFVGISAVTISVAVFACVMIWRTRDLSPLAYLIPSVFAELATATGFYYRKAQKENEIKLPKYIENQSMASSEEPSDEIIQ